jgi:hypothetical protein
MVTRCAGPAAGRVAGGPAVLLLLDRRHQLALAHPGSAGHAERLGEPLELGQQHPGGSRASAAARPGCRSLTGLAALVRPGTCSACPVGSRC